MPPFGAAATALLDSLARDFSLEDAMAVKKVYAAPHPGFGVLGRGAGNPALKLEPLSGVTLFKAAVRAPPTSLEA